MTRNKAVAKPSKNLSMLNISMIHFYCFHNNQQILISDLPVEKVRAKYGHKYEVVNSIKDRSYLDQIKERVARSYPKYIITEAYHKVNRHTEEARKKISESKIGKPRDEETRKKISDALKGRSNFQGKKHSEETKQQMRLKKLGNQHVKDYYWAHDPNGDREIRVKSREDIPEGFRQGRDYYSTESGLYYFINRHLRGKSATNSPKETQSNSDLQTY